eukprot:6186846-Pleurochrysis_carterae.AAC.5
MQYGRRWGRVAWKGLPGLVTHVLLSSQRAFALATRMHAERLLEKLLGLKYCRGNVHCIECGAMLGRSAVNNGTDVHGMRSCSTAAFGLFWVRCLCVALRTSGRAHLSACSAIVVLACTQHGLAAV